MRNMVKCAETLKRIRVTGSTNAKQDILKKAIKEEYSDTLLKVLRYTYDPFKKYGLSDKTLNSIKPNEATFVKATEENVFKMLDILAKSNINDSLRAQAKGLLMSIEDDDVRAMVQNIMTKDLKIGMNTISINKVCGKHFIPKFEVQLAESLTKQKPGSMDKKKIWVTQKLDGHRCIFIPDEGKFYTRQGQEIEGLDHLVKEATCLSRLVSDRDEEFVLDGELIHKPVDGMNSGELYSLTTSVARKKGKTKEKENLQFNVFDIIPLSEFKVGLTILTYGYRRKQLDQAFEIGRFSDVVRVPVLYEGKFDMEIISSLLKEVESGGGEGLMINVDSLYEMKRTKNLLKVKSFHTADVLVKEVYEGTGRNVGKLGGIVFEFLLDGQVKTCDCGSGFSDEEREMYYKNPELLVGKVVEIQYFEISKDTKTGEQAMRFPTWQHRVRNDKGVTDITDVMVND